MIEGSRSLDGGHVEGRGPRPPGPWYISVSSVSAALPDVVIMSISRVLLLHPCLMLRPVHLDEDRGDLQCPWYTDCQQLRDETRPVSCTSTSVQYTSSTIHYTTLVLYYPTII